MRARIHTGLWRCQQSLTVRTAMKTGKRERENETGRIQWGDGSYAGRHDKSHLRHPLCQETHEGSLKPYTSELLQPCLAWLNRIGWCFVTWIPLIPLIHLLHLKLWRKDIHYGELLVSLAGYPFFKPGSEENLHIIKPLVCILSRADICVSLYGIVLIV